MAVENVATMDGRIITETRLPASGIPVLADREGGPQLVLGWIENVTRAPAPAITATIVPGAFYLLGTPDFGLRKHRGLAPQAEFADATVSEIETASGRVFSLVRGAKLTAVVLGKRPAWMGMEIR